MRCEQNVFEENIVVRPPSPDIKGSSHRQISIAQTSYFGWMVGAIGPQGSAPWDHDGQYAAPLQVRDAAPLEVPGG